MSISKIKESVKVVHLKTSLVDINVNNVKNKNKMIANTKKLLENQEMKVVINLIGEKILLIISYSIT